MTGLALNTWGIPGVNAGGVHPAVDPALTLSGVNTPVHVLVHAL